MEAVQQTLCICKIYLAEEKCQFFTELLVKADRKRRKGGGLRAGQSLGCSRENQGKQLQDWLLITEDDQE